MAFNLNQSITRESAFPLDSREIFADITSANSAKPGLYAGQKISIVPNTGTICHYTVDNDDSKTLKPLINAASGGLITANVANDGKINSLTGTFTNLYIGGSSYNVKTQIDNKASKSITITAGDGLTGGGKLNTSDITLNVGAGNGIDVTDSEISVKTANNGGINVDSTGVSHYTPLGAGTENDKEKKSRTYINSIKFDSFGHVTSVSTATETVTDTHYTATLHTGAKDSTSNATSATSNPYLILRENNTNRSQIQIKGSGKTTVSADDGIITINSTDTNTTYDLSAPASRTNGNVTIDLTAGGSGAGTDSVTIKGSGGTTVETDANGNINISSPNVSENIEDVDVILSEDLVTYYNIGKITTASGTNPVTIAKKGNSLKTVFNKLFLMEAETPTTTTPSLSLTLSNNSSNIEYGKAVTFTATVTATTGRYNSSGYSGGYTTNTGISWSSINIKSTNSSFTTKNNASSGTSYTLTPSSTYYAVSNGGSIKGEAVASNGYSHDGQTFAKNNLGETTTVKINSSTTPKSSSEAVTEVVSGYVPYTYTLATSTPSSLPTSNRSRTKYSSITVSGGSSDTFLYIFTPTSSSISSIKAGGFDVPFEVVSSSESYVVNNEKSTTFKVYKTSGAVISDTFTIS